MNIKEIITKHYDELHRFCDPNKTISLGLTEEDIMHNVFMTAMRKFKDEDVDEEEAMSYLKLTMYEEQLFQRPRMKKDLLVLIGDIKGPIDYSKMKDFGQ